MTSAEKRRVAAEFERLVPAARNAIFHERARKMNLPQPKPKKGTGPAMKPIHKLNIVTLLSLCGSYGDVAVGDSGVTCKRCLAAMAAKQRSLYRHLSRDEQVSERRAS